MATRDSWANARFNDRGSRPRGNPFNFDATPFVTLDGFFASTPRTGKRQPLYLLSERERISREGGEGTNWRLARFNDLILRRFLPFLCLLLSPSKDRSTITPGLASKVFRMKYCIPIRVQLIIATTMLDDVCSKRSFSLFRVGPSISGERRICDTVQGSERL